MLPKIQPPLTEQDVLLIKELVRDGDIQGAKVFIESKGLVFEEYGVVVIPSTENKHF